MPQPAQASGGYVLLHRSIFDNPVFRNAAEALAFNYLAALAAWRPCRVRYKDREIVLERGQLAISVRDLAEDLGKSAPAIQRFLARLKTDTLIETRTDTGITIITICDYSKFQPASQPADTPIGTAADTGPIQSRYTEQRKEEKEERKKPSSISPSFFDEPAKAKANGKATACPWQVVPDDQIEWAMEDRRWRRADAVAEGQRFIDNKLANAKTHADWPAAWRYWCRNHYQQTKAANAGMGSA